MTDIHAIISKATSDLIDLTGYEKAVDIQSVLYMNLSGYTLEEECTEVAEAGLMSCPLRNHRAVRVRMICKSHSPQIVVSFFQVS